VTAHSRDEELKVVGPHRYNPAAPDPMKPEVHPSFYKALAGAGRKTTPEELAKQGVRRLRTYKMSEVSFLIERALNKTLAQRMLKPLPAEEMSELADAVEQEFKKQLGGVNELRASRGELNHQRDSAKRELSRFREEVKQRIVAAPKPGSSRVLLNDLSEAFKPIAAQFTGPDWVIKGVITDLQALIEARVATALETEREAVDAQIGKLERRIAKLVGTTETMERALGSLAEAREPDIGIASIYRTTQGLSKNEANKEAKRAMMSDIFKANLELRAKLQPSPAT
jgi:hypothetical protein